MPYFTDSKDRQWNVRVTPYGMREVKDFADINLGTILQDGMKPLAELLDDPADLCAVIYALCKQQADDKGIDLRDFMEGIVGDPLEKAAAALVEGLRDCFPTTKRAMLTAVLTMMQHNERETKRKVKTILRDLIYLNSLSRWQRLLVWIRGTTQVMS